jgi:predicted aconitase/predicted aconitase with swiveling domain
MSHHATFHGTELIGGIAETTKLLISGVGLSFWGGVDPLTSQIVDHTHPLFEEYISDTILAIPNGRGSCTGSQVVLELLLNKMAPRALILRQSDSILALGVLVAEEMFGVSIPVINIGKELFDHLLLETPKYCAIYGQSLVFGNSREKVDFSFQTMTEDKDNIFPPPSTANEILYRSKLTLTEEEQMILEMKEENGISMAMKILARAAAIDDAPCLLEIKQAHIDGCTYIGPGGLQFAEKLVALGAKVRVPTTLNSNSIDRNRWESLGISSKLGKPAKALGDAYINMGCSNTSFTCAPYLLDTKPLFGEQIAWGESNAVVYSNSVLGARTQKYADYLDICAAITGKAPMSGCHLNEERYGTIVLDVGSLSKDVILAEENDEKSSNSNLDALFPLLGYMCGLKSESNVPVIIGLEEYSNITLDDLKAFSAAFGSTASVPMFHMVGHTPEAPSLNIALGGVDEIERIQMNVDDMNNAWHLLNKSNDTNDKKIDLVALGNPHLSLNECKTISELCNGYTARKNVSIIATLGRDIYGQAKKKGYIKKMSRFGVKFISDTCWCMLTEPVVPIYGNTVLTNSAKYAHYGPALTGKNVRFHSLNGCINAAKTGYLPPLPKWIQRNIPTMIRRF